MKANLFLVFTLTLFASALAFISTNSVSDSTKLPIIPTNENMTCAANYTCVLEGDDCQPDNNCTAEAGNCCALGLTCLNSTCMADTIGEFCSKTQPCFSNDLGAATACINNTCYYQYQANDECDEDYDCVTGNCTEGLCVGAMAGEKCTKTQTYQTCAYGLACTAGVCTAQSGLNETCKTNGDCMFGYTCLSNKCIGAFSQEEDQPCQENQDCSGGLICFQDKCSEGSEWEQDSCDDSTDCPSGEQCVCSLYSGDKFCLPMNPTNYSNLNQNQDELYECIRDNNCTHLSTAPDSCSEQNCGSDVSDSYEQGCGLAESFFNKCVSNPVCEGGFPVWAIILIVVVCILVLVAIVAAAVMCMRKNRNDYDSI